MYQGSEARRFDSHELLPQTDAPQFQVREGAGRDAQRRRGVDAAFMSVVKLCIACALSICCIGGIRVGITAATAQALGQAQSLRIQIEKAQAAEGELKVERSVLSRGTRITHIASEQYGMVMAGSPEKLSLPKVAAPKDTTAALRSPRNK